MTEMMTHAFVYLLFFLKMPSMLNLPSVHGRLVNALQRGLPCTVSGVQKFVTPCFFVLWFKDT